MHVNNDQFALFHYLIISINLIKTEVFQKNIHYFRLFQFIIQRILFQKLAVESNIMTYFRSFGLLPFEYSFKGI